MNIAGGHCIVFMVSYVYHGEIHCEIMGELHEESDGIVWGTSEKTDHQSPIAACGNGHYLYAQQRGQVPPHGDCQDVPQWVCTGTVYPVEYIWEVSRHCFKQGSLCCIQPVE